MSTEASRRRGGWEREGVPVGNEGWVPVSQGQADARQQQELRSRWRSGAEANRSRGEGGGRRAPGRQGLSDQLPAQLPRGGRTKGTAAARVMTERNEEALEQGQTLCSHGAGGGMLPW